MRLRCATSLQGPPERQLQTKLVPICQAHLDSWSSRHIYGSAQRNASTPPTPRRRGTSISMAGEHPLALSLAGGRTRGSPAGTTTVASALPEQRQATVEIERARRRQMSRLYAELGALLPDLPRRAPKERILEEAIAYVGALRGTVAKLEAHGAVDGAGRRAAADGACAVAAEVLAAERASFFAARLPAARRPGALTRVLEVFRRHGVPVLAATVTSNAGEAAVTVTTGAVAPSVVEGIKADISRSIA